MGGNDNNRGNTVCLLVTYTLSVMYIHCQCMVYIVSECLHAYDYFPSLLVERQNTEKCTVCTDFVSWSWSIVGTEHAPNIGT